MSFTLHGLAVSGGIAIGQAHLISQATLEVSHLVISPRLVEKEIARFDAALARVRGELAAIIDEHAASDAAFRDTLTRLLAEAEQNGAHVSSVAQTAWGSQNVQIADVRGSTITTSIGSSPETLRAPNEHR